MLMNAEEARAQVQKNIEFYEKEEWRMIEETVNNAVAERRTEVSIHKKISITVENTVIQKLQFHGRQVDNYDIQVSSNRSI